MPGDTLFGLLEVEKILLDVNGFEKFIEKNKLEKKKLFSGYLFAIRCTQRQILNNIARSYYLNLKSDTLWERANFTGVYIKKVPATCRLAVVTKNLHKFYSEFWAIKNKNSFEEIKNKTSIPLKINILLTTILQTHFTKHSKYKELSNEDVKLAHAKFMAMAYLNDLSTFHGIPNAFNVSILEWGLEENFLNFAFEGYKSALAYLWQELLANEENLISKKILEAKNWSFLDKVFGIIREQIIRPLETEKNFEFLFDKNFIKISNIRFNEFDILSNKLVESPYLTNKEKLRQVLLWYEISPLYPEKIFNGVGAFKLLLRGAVQEYWLVHHFKPKIIRFKHPQEVGNNYSYAILIEGYGVISDFSGWVLFFNCATDYSGFGGAEHAYAEGAISYFQKYLDVKEFTLSIKELEDFLPIIPEREYKHTLVTDPKGILKKLREFKNQEKHDTGTILELAVLYCLNSSGFKIIKWSYEKKHEYQIDILAEKNGEKYVVECMNTVPKYKRIYGKLIQELKKKKNKLNDKAECIIVTNYCSPNVVGEFEKQKIQVIGFNKLLSMAPIGSIKKSQIISRLKINRFRFKKYRFEELELSL